MIVGELTVEACRCSGVQRIPAVAAELMNWHRGHLFANAPPKPATRTARLIAAGRASLRHMRICFTYSEHLRVATDPFHTTGGAPLCTTIYLTLSIEVNPLLL
jgi:hypothetical protein